jgi:hypothetical protein
VGDEWDGFQSFVLIAVLIAVYWVYSGLVWGLLRIIGVDESRGITRNKFKQSEIEKVGRNDS